MWHEKEDQLHTTLIMPSHIQYLCDRAVARVLFIYDETFVILINFHNRNEKILKLD